MNISNISVSFRTAIMVLVILLAVGGVVSYTTLPKEANPEVEIPIVLVTTIYPGASPSDVESLITQPVEKELQGIAGIDEIRSTSAEGASIVVIEFVAGTNTTEAYQRVRDRVDQARPNLPSDVEDPMITEIDLEDFPIMTINLAAPYSLARLQQVAERLQDELETIPGVLEVERVGGLEREVQVNVDLNALQAHNLSFNDISQAIQREHANIPGGGIDVDRLNYLIRIDGEIRDPEELNFFVVSSPEGVPVYLRDIADIDFGFKDRESYARMRVIQVEEDGRNRMVMNDESSLQVISLNVKQRSGSNTLETAGAVKSTLENYPFPSGTETIITGDRSEDVETLVTDLENNIISGLIFVVLVLLFFLGVRNASLVAVAIPLSMFLTFIILQAMDVSLNFIVLFTLIVALGILVDNAIVIIENIYRYREEGHGRLEAARMGAAEFTGAISVATLTMVLTFSPMLFWPGIVGEFMGYLPLTLIVALASSLFVAIFVSPALMAIFGRTPDEPKKPLSRAAWYALLAGLAVGVLVLGLTNWITLLVLAVAIPILVLLYRLAFRPIAGWFIERRLPQLVEQHRELLRWMMERDYDVRRPYLRNTLALGALTCGMILLLFGGIIAGFANVMAASILLIPGGILTIVGVLGVILHTFEGFFLGGRSTVKAGVILVGVMLVLFLLSVLSPSILTLEIALTLLVLPLLVIVAGLLGMFFGRNRRRLILTDNRALLLNGTLGSFVLVVGFLMLAPIDVTFFPETDPNQVRITMEAPLGTNIDYSNQIAQVADERLNTMLQDEENVRLNTKNFITNVGVSGGGAFAFGMPQSERSRIVLNLVDYADRSEPSRHTLRHIRDVFEDIFPGVNADIDRDEMGPPTGPPVNIEISGPDFNQITAITQEVRRMLEQAVDRGEIEGLVDLRDNLEIGRPEMRIEVDRERAARYGLSTSQVAQTVRAAVSGIEAATYRDGEDEFDITVRLAPQQRASLESLENLTITNAMGERVPLVSMAEFVMDEGVGAITRLNLQRLSTVEGRNAPGFTSQQVLMQVQEHLSEYRESLPPGYSMTFTGETQEQDEAFGFLLFALFAGIMLIFLVTVAKFNSISAPIMVLLAVGLSQIGVVFTLLVTRTPFSLMVFVGIISLFGILVNNNIVLLDYINQLRRQGLSQVESIIVGASNRLRPVLLTALTTILALLPLTLGLNIDFRGLLISLDPAIQFGSENTQFWGPMGVTIIGGLIFALYVTLVLVPTIFSAFESLAARMATVFGMEDEEAYAGDGAALRPAHAGAATHDGDGTPRQGVTPHPETG